MSKFSALLVRSSVDAFFLFCFLQHAIISRNVIYRSTICAGAGICVRNVVLENGCSKNKRQLQTTKVHRRQHPFLTVELASRMVSKSSIIYALCALFDNPIHRNAALTVQSPDSTLDSTFAMDRSLLTFTSQTNEILST